jgi:hypothetical protein
MPIALQSLTDRSPIGGLADWEQYRSPGDFYGFERPATAAKRSWGPIQQQDSARSTTQYHGGAASVVLNDFGHFRMRVPVSAVSTTITVQVYREANYAGTNPQMIVRQPGQADDVTTDAAAASQFNELSTTLTPDSGTDWVDVILKSNNTATSGSYAVYFDTITVSPTVADPGKFEVWITDRVPFGTLPPASGDTGDFEAWLWDRQHFEEFMDAGLEALLERRAMRGIARGVMRGA